jgi:hypothetical protein
MLYKDHAYHIFCLLVMNDLHKCLEHPHNVLFLEDVTLLISSKLNDLHKTTPNLECDQCIVRQWMQYNILELKS